MFKSRIFSRDRSGNNDKMTSKKIPMFFDIEEKRSIEIEIQRETTCLDIHIKYQNKIFEMIKDISKNSSNTIIDPSSFLIIDKENKYTRIKLKENDKPWNYLKTKSINLFYMDSKITGTPKSDEEASQKEKNKVVILINPEEYLREGELLKYSYKTKKFKKRTVRLDRNKLMLIKVINKTQSTWSVTLLSEIKSIEKGTKNAEIKDKYVFEVNTEQKDKIILKAKNSTDYLGWVNELTDMLYQTREDKYFQIYSKSAEELSKSIYDKEMLVLWNIFSSRGALSQEKLFNYYTKFLKNGFIEKITYETVNYFLSYGEHDYFSAYSHFQDLISSLDLENFEVEKYKSTGNKDQNFFVTNIDKSLFIKNLMCFDTLKKYKKIYLEFEDFISKGELVIRKGNLNSEKLLQTKLSPRLLAEVFENLVTKILSNHYKKTLEIPEYIMGVEKILAIYFLDRNHFEMIKLSE